MTRPAALCSVAAVVLLAGCGAAVEDLPESDYDVRSAEGVVRVPLAR